MSMSVEDLQTKYPLVDWKTLLSALVGHTVRPDTTIQLYFENYFDSLFIKLSEVFNADNKNRMNMHNALLAMFAHDLHVDLVETRSPCNREDYCLRVASGLLEDVSSALYLSTFTREELNAMELELQTLFTQLKFTLQEQFQDVKWLDDSSRSYLTSKLQQLVPVTDGGRVFLGDSYLLNERLSEVDMNISNSYLQNAVQLMGRYRSSMYSLFSNEPNLTDTIWTHFLLPYDTQAIAIYQLNTVVIPFGLIGSPQSTPDLPAYVFKARVGNDIARQIAHHFDTTGIEYGSNGKDVNLLSDATRYHYSNIKYCDEATYSYEKSWTNQEHQIFTYKTEASQSMNERFADSSALHLSYQTFRKNAALEPLLPWLDMSHDKLYYMLVAQELCTKGGMLDYTVQLFESEQMPPFLRVANLAQNSEEFSQAYSCGRGTQMNPEVKCGSFPELREMDGSDSDLSPQ
ncbi:hypothetical protein B7P43_G01308 [Cryptotermes secundus]|uniref:Peptidase M13 C-terminal domain-containing protein n=3 Tax=Cryptotermes secundus TaxID=105785 RepID=A0A2J7REE8_9NEOP|nr:hypothetical protein B7P43_G01308 [Cryptotermes secundus]